MIREREKIKKIEDDYITLKKINKSKYFDLE
jgi:hypothetical protein